MTTGNVRVT